MNYNIVDELITAQHQFNVTNIIPDNIGIDILCHMTLLPSNTYFRTLLQQHPRFYQVMAHYSIIHDCNYNKQSIVRQWIHDYWLTLANEWKMTGVIDPTYKELVRQSYEFSFLPIRDDRGWASITKKSKDPLFLAFITNTHPHLTRASDIQTYFFEPIVQKLQGSDWLDYLSFLHPHAQHTLFCVRSLKSNIYQKIKETLIQQQEPISIEQYAERFSLYQQVSFSPNNGISTKETIPSLITRLFSAMKNDNAARSFLMQTIHAFKQPEDITIEDITYLLNDKFGYHCLASFMDSFSVLPVDVQTALFHGLHQNKSEWGNYSCDLKTIFHHELSQNAIFRDAVSPMFSDIQQGHPLRSQEFHKNMDVYLRLFLREYHPDLLKTMKTLGVSNLKDILTHYHRQAHGPTTEVPLCF